VPVPRRVSRVGVASFKKGRSTRLLRILHPCGNAKTTCPCGLFVLDTFQIVFGLFVAVTALPGFCDGVPDEELGSIEIPT
jgi:hypothetical protein